MRYTVYTDGSDLKHTSHRMGVGGVLIRDGQKYDEFSYELGLKYLRENYGTDDCSNPMAEMLAIKVAFDEWERFFNPGDEVEFKSDYTGCKEWLSGRWKINKPYIKKVYDEIQRYIESTGIIPTFSWVKGHQVGPSIYGTDKYWNDLTDKLSKGDRKRNKE